MGSSILSFAAVFLVVCLYFSTNQVKCQDETTAFSCPGGLQPGMSANYKPCSRCTCEDSGFACKTCSATAPVPVPANCELIRKEGDFPDCCEKEVVCN